MPWYSELAEGITGALGSVAVVANSATGARNSYNQISDAITGTAVEITPTASKAPAPAVQQVTNAVENLEITAESLALPWYKKPWVYLAGGAGVLVLGFLIFRRKR